MKCEYCELIADRSKAEILYEDEEVVVAVKDLVMTPGQITVFPKEHFTILEMVPDKILRKCAAMANKVSIAAFESIGCQGTNIIIQNGVSAGQKVPHFAFEVVPRREGDGLNLQWEPRQLMEDEMDTAFLLLKEEGEKLVDIGKKEKKAKVESKEEPKKEKIKEEKSSGEKKDNYLLKSLKRIP